MLCSALGDLSRQYNTSGLYNTYCIIRALTTLEYEGRKRTEFGLAMRPDYAAQLSADKGATLDHFLAAVHCRQCCQAFSSFTQHNITPLPVSNQHYHLFIRHKLYSDRRDMSNLNTVLYSGSNLTCKAQQKCTFTACV